MNDYTLTLEKLTKRFNRRTIFKDVNLEIKSPGIYGIAGANGSGKSTLVKTIACLQSPTSGKAIHSIDGKPIDPNHLHNHIGFMAPYLNLYEEFSAEENIARSAAIRGIVYDRENVHSLFEFFRIADRKNDILKTYSSGMKQRVKAIFAFAHKPALLILDEPTSNLDIPGKEQVYEMVRKASAAQTVIIASNEESDLALCQSTIAIEDYKPKGGQKK